jgi:hypothetical protein
MRFQYRSMTGLTAYTLRVNPRKIVQILIHVEWHTQAPHWYPSGIPKA